MIGVARVKERTRSGATILFGGLYEEKVRLASQFRLGVQVLELNIRALR
jgi:hypothetical protein